MAVLTCRSTGLGLGTAISSIFLQDCTEYRKFFLIPAIGLFLSPITFRSPVAAESKLISLLSRREDGSKSPMAVPR